MTTYGAPSSSSAAAASSAVVQTNARAVGTPAAAITSLANALDPSSCAAARDGPNTAMPQASDGVGDARDQRRLGADDDQVDARATRPGAATAAPSSGSTSCSVATAAIPGLPGRGVHLGDRRVEGQRPGQGVLAPAGADDEGLHGRGRHVAAVRRDTDSE